MCTCPWPGSLLETLPVGHPVFQGNHSFRGGFESPKALVRKAILSTEIQGPFSHARLRKNENCDYIDLHACDETHIYVYHVMYM